MRRRCEALCGANGKNKCGGCLSAYFCSASCQQKLWKSHKKICRARKRGVVKIQSSWRGWIVRSSRRSTAIMMPDVVGLEMKTIVMDRLQCEVCGIPEPKCEAHQLCDGCKLSLFCSRTCQKVGWKRHKRICFERRRSAVAIQSAWRKMSRDREGRRKAALTIRSAPRQKRGRKVAHPNRRHPGVEEGVVGLAFVTICALLGRSYMIFLLPGFTFLFVTMKIFQDLAKPLVLRFREKPMMTHIHTASRIILKLLSNENTSAVSMLSVCIWALGTHMPHWYILMIHDNCGIVLLGITFIFTSDAISVFLVILLLILNLSSWQCLLTAYLRGGNVY